MLYDTWNHYIHGLVLHLVNEKWLKCIVPDIFQNRQNQWIDFQSNKLQKQRTADQKWSLHLWDGKNKKCVTPQVLGASEQTRWMTFTLHTQANQTMTSSTKTCTQSAQFPLQWSMGYNWLGKTSWTPEEAYECKNLGFCREHHMPEYMHITLTYALARDNASWRHQTGLQIS